MRYQPTVSMPWWLASQVAKDLTHVDAAVLARRLRPALLEAQWLCETGTPR